MIKRSWYKKNMKRNRNMAYTIKKRIDTLTNAIYLACNNEAYKPDVVSIMEEELIELKREYKKYSHIRGLKNSKCKIGFTICAGEV